MTALTKRRRHVGATRIALSCAVALVGLWVGSASLGIYVARSNPGFAGSLNGASAEIMGLRARGELEAGNLTKARRLALAALRRDPTVLPAVQTLGLAAGVGSNLESSERLLGYAQRLSRRNLQTHLWAIESSVSKGDVASALGSYDRALRTSLSAREILFPVLANAIADPAVARALAARLGQKPLWSESFLWFLGSEAQVDPVTAVRLFALARHAGAVIQPAALSAVVSRSLDNQRYAAAWAAYAILRPSVRRTEIRDPHFGHLPDYPSMFDWTLASDGSIQARGTGTELEVEAGSGATGVAVEQRQMLPQGRYQLTVTNGSVPLGSTLTWSVTCQEGPELARLLVTAGPGGQSASPGFIVPANCPLQNLALIVDAGESPTGLRVAVKKVSMDQLRER